jgi:hypothetical protein
MKDEERIEQAASAWRPRDPRDGRARPHPAWLDLDAAGRQAAFDAAAEARRLEAALDPAGLSTTARAVLARIVSGGRRG